MSWGGNGVEKSRANECGIVTREPKIAVRGRNPLTLEVVNNGLYNLY